MINFIQSLDNSVLLFIKDNMHSFAMDRAMIFFTSIGNSGLIWIFAAIILLISKKHRKTGIVLAISLILGAVLGEAIIKNIVQRPRPCVNIPAADMLIAKPLSYSFPSGHTTSSFAAAGVLAKYYRGYAPWFFIMAAIIAFSRLYLYVHYPSDVLAGIILGILCSKAAIYIFNKYIKDKLKREEN